MVKLCRTLAAMEESLIALERRGISLRHARPAARSGHRQAADLSRVPAARRNIGSTNARRARQFCRSARRGNRRRKIDDPPPLPAGESTGPAARGSTGEEKTNGHGEPAVTAPRCTSSSCTKCARSTRSWAIWQAMGFDLQSLIPQERTGTEEPPLHPAPRRKHRPAWKICAAWFPPFVPPAKKD